MDRFRNFGSQLRATATLLLALASPLSVHAAVDAWPLLEIDEDTTTVLYPLYVDDGDFQMVFPLYYRTNEGRDHHALWPLAKVSDGRLERFAPFYFSAQEDRFTLFPLIHQSENATWWMVPPVYLSRAEDFHAVFPLYAHDPETTWVLPNLRIERDEEGATTNVHSLGVFQWQRAGRVEELDVVGFFGLRRGGDDFHARAVPLFSVTRSDDRSNTWVGPVNVAQADVGTSDERKRFCVLPVYCDKRGPGLRERFIGPWYEWQDAASEKTGVLGLYGQSERVAEDGARTDGLSLLAWSYARSTTRDGEGRIVERNRRFLVFTDRLTPTGRSLGILGFPIWEDVSSTGSVRAEGRTEGV